MKKIILAEDDKAIAEVVSIILSDEGYEVDVVTRYEEIIAYLNKNNVGLILLDLWLSGENGADVCKKIKGNEKTKTIPIIILSANNNIKDIATEANAEDYLPKPFDMDALLQKVHTYLPQK